MLPRPSGSKQQKPRIPPQSFENSLERRHQKPRSPEVPPPPDTFTELPDYLKQYIGAQVKHEAKQFADNFWEQLIGIDQSSSTSSPQQEMMKQAEKQQGANHTPLDFESLSKKHQEKEQPNLEALRKKFHQMVNTDTEKAIETRKKEEEERKKAEAEEEQRKKEEEEQEKQEQMAADEPEGKQKGKIGQPRNKKAHIQETNFEAKQRKKG